MRPLVANPSTAADWQTRYYHADYVGSIRRLTDESGLVTDGYTYTAFGELLGHTGTDAQPYAFTGEPYDPNVGFQYHRARWMDPRAGRFVGMDPFEGLTTDPLTLHRYLYGRLAPATYVDHDGREFSLAGSMAVCAIMGAIAGGLSAALNGANAYEIAASSVLGAAFGAASVLVGAGVGVALLGNAARGVFVTGVGLSAGGLGVNVFDFATAPDPQSQQNAARNLAINVALMYFGPKILQRANTRFLSGKQCNDEFLARNPGGQKPWVDGGEVMEKTIFMPAKYVRVYDDAGNPMGVWLTTADDIAGLTFAQIQQRLALPRMPTRMIVRDVPAGTTLRLGEAGANDFGPGGGFQALLMN
jgi:RHS repeat-associated protein